MLLYSSETSTTYAGKEKRRNMMLRLILHTARPSMIIIPKRTSVSYTNHDPHPGITVRDLVRANCAARTSELLLICEDSLKLKTK